MGIIPLLLAFGGSVGKSIAKLIGIVEMADGDLRGVPVGGTAHLEVSSAGVRFKTRGGKKFKARAIELERES